MGKQLAKPDVPAEKLVPLGRKEPLIDGAALRRIEEDAREIYLADNRPWVIGFSGGKDSTTALQLIWYAISKLPPDKRKKPVFVIASDTLVETPVIVDAIDQTLARINDAAERTQMPFRAEKVRPILDHTFWVNMIGRGYPAPYRRFRWCTDRLKIEPANRFIEDRVSQYGEVVLILGVRKAESATRAQVMALHRKPGDRLSRHTTLRSAWVYTPVEDFTVDDVWTYLLSVPSPWGNNNRDLVAMYRNAQAGECPLVVDKTTPSCGNSRFGCWVCTVVERDRSMEAMIDNGQDWMQSLLDFRDWLFVTREPSRKHEYREVRRRSGRVDTWGDKGEKIIWGPYKLTVRKQILQRLLQTQRHVREIGPDPSLGLISERELHEIRRLWRMEEGDWEDALPTIYREVMGTDLDWVEEDFAGGTALDNQVLAAVCEKHDVPTGVLRELIDLQRELQGLGRRSAVYDRIERVLGKDWRSAEQVFSDIGWQPEGDDDEGDEANAN
jgi:DNA sulfur modification protein DndC